jgi:hypothetical protein
MNVTLNLITEFEDIPHEVAHMLKFVQDELSFTARRAANVSSKLAGETVDANEALDLLHSVRLQMAYQHYLDNPPEEEPEATAEGEENEEG